MYKEKTCLAIAAILSSAMMAGPANAVEFGAFGNIKLTTSTADDTSNGFALGQVDFYVTHQIDEHTGTFIEYVFEPEDDGFELDVERLWIKRKINDAFQIGAGRFHSPLGYWNSYFHHGVLLQDTVSRPFFLGLADSHDAILPMHITGLMAEGALHDNLSYEFSLSNSSFIDSTGSVNASLPGDGAMIGIGNTGDISDGKTVIGRLTYHVPATPLNASVFSMMNSIVEAAGTGDTNFGALTVGNELIDQAVAGIDLRYLYNNFDMLAEYYNIKNDSNIQDEKSHTATAYYIQIGYQPADTYKVVYRYASLAFDAEAGDKDAYFDLLGSNESVHHTVAFRCNLDDSNALTLEFDRNDPEDSSLDSETTTTLDWAFLIF
ncbi:MAG TPA: hypothetical protein VIH66_01035 [Gammaproteobacteria bacterium]